jgi:hypothetical protein
MFFMVVLVLMVEFDQIAVIGRVRSRHEDAGAEKIPPWGASLKSGKVGAGGCAVVNSGVQESAGSAQD